MRAGIIAAGEGSRFRAAGISTPKPLLQVAGRSLLERTIAGLTQAGIDEIALIVSEAMAEVAEVARALPVPVPLATVTRTTASSMHSLYHLREHLEGERFVLCTIDTVLQQEELFGFISEFAARTDLDVQLAYTDFVDDEKPLYIGIGPDGRALSLGQPAQLSETPFVTAGLYGMSPAIWPILEEAVQSGLERLRNFLALLLERGMVVGGHRISQAVDVDRPSDLEVAERFLQQMGKG
jgi:NDP-sugar pyrophosphorylase family protein